MRVSTTQRRIILAGVAVLALMGLFPPWTHTIRNEGISSEEPAGYGFIAWPPPKKYDSATSGLKIDLSRLLIQWAVTIAATGSGVLLTAKREDEPKG